MVEVDLVKKIIIRRIEDETRGIKRVIRITPEMKSVIEETKNLDFHPKIPFTYHILSWYDKAGGEIKMILVSEAKVIDKDKIFVPLDKKIKGRVSFMACRYQRIAYDKAEKCMKITSIPVEEMKGWQFKGNAKAVKNGIVLNVDEIYCAISGKKLQETMERYNEKLVEGIVKFFYNISGKLAFKIAKDALKKKAVYLTQEFILKGVVKKINYKEIIEALLEEYSKVFGKKFAENIPTLLNTISEALRIKPSVPWKVRK
jgi:hypothetical protein